MRDLITGAIAAIVVKAVVAVVILVYHPAVGAEAGWHWPGCHEPPCPPPLAGLAAGQYSASFYAELLEHHPDLCTCGLLCPAKCEAGVGVGVEAPEAPEEPHADGSCVKQCLFGGGATCAACCAAHPKASGCFPH